MMAVGASDAFFCKAYVDLISRTLRAMQRESNLEVPDGIFNVMFPISIIASRGTSGLGYRIGSRLIMEKESFLSLNSVKKKFNVFYEPNMPKALTDDKIISWIHNQRVKKRHYGITSRTYRSLGATQKSSAKKNAGKTFRNLFAKHYQRRNDCIHNCDRIKEKPQRITESMAKKCVEDYQFLVGEMHEDLSKEFEKFLRRIGCTPATIRSVSY